MHTAYTYALHRAAEKLKKGMRKSRWYKLYIAQRQKDYVGSSYIL